MLDARIEGEGSENVVNYGVKFRRDVLSGASAVIFVGVSFATRDVDEKLSEAP